MTYEPTADSRATLAQAINDCEISADFMAGTAAGVASISVALDHGLALLEHALGNDALTTDVLRKYINDVATGMIDEFRGHEVRLRAAEETES